VKSFHARLQGREIRLVSSLFFFLGYEARVRRGRAEEHPLPQHSAVAAHLHFHFQVPGKEHKRGCDGRAANKRLQRPFKSESRVRAFSSFHVQESGAICHLPSGSFEVIWV
jgi:hypothetical protein